MEPKIDKTIITKKGGSIIIPRKIIRSEYPKSSGTPEENVIKTSPQNLTEEEQNQARKNQGLYHTEVASGGEEEIVPVEPKYLTSCTVIPFTKSANGNITCDLSMEELNNILRNNQYSDVCPALNGVLGIPGYTFYRDNGSNSLVFAFQYFGGDAGRLRIDDGGEDSKTITSLSAFNLGYTLLFVSQDGNVREEDAAYSVPLWTVPSL